MIIVRFSFNKMVKTIH